MRYFSLAITGLLALTASASPLPLQLSDVLPSSDYKGPTPAEVQATVKQAVYISQNLNSEITRIMGEIESDPLLKLEPTGYNTPLQLKYAFAQAIAGIEALPTVATSGQNVPVYIANSYAPLVRVITETVFLSLLDLKRLFTDVAQNPIATDIATQTDGGLYEFVILLSRVFQGSGCQLAKAVGNDNAAGQALKVASERLFYNLFDSISTGTCK
ncbi:uncharacterized protein MKK02DRAFT_30299 [Dioszegia hungarica]|uniref:Uncharacterized protein n=1 Tax=Dioszegia hungarica TaxID=4972 RepID=A0AA38LSD8_9TREE|nr:uncharacterized protein MKK02DRAFT_30299 [Dioszegia hungarica]KAI9632504.1 hypothetical protein MKK02DRAFT_30299 [Dioszegia hungarica]